MGRLCCKTFKVLDLYFRRYNNPSYNDQSTEIYIVLYLSTKTSVNIVNIESKHSYTTQNSRKTVLFLLLYPVVRPLQ